MKRIAPLMLFVFLLSCDSSNTPSGPTVQLFTAALTPDVTNPADRCLYVSEITSQTGTQVTIAIRVANVQDLAGLVVFVHYPPNLLRLSAYNATNSVMAGVWGTDWDVTAYHDTGEAVIIQPPGFLPGVPPGNAGFTGSGILVELRFDILAIGQASMWMDSHLAQDHNGNWFDTAVHGAQIQITEQ